MPLQPIRRDYEFEKKLEPESCITPTGKADYWEYLKIIKDLTPEELKIKTWLEIEGYWEYLSGSHDCIHMGAKEGAIQLMTPTLEHREYLKHRAIEILVYRFGMPQRLYFPSELVVRR